MPNSLPVIGGSSGTWGNILNSFLSVALVTSGTAAGSLTLVSSQTGSYAIGSTAYTTGGETVLANASTASFSVTLPNAATYTSAIHSVKKVDSSSHAVTINSSGGNIDGGSTAAIYIQYLSLSFASDGTNWNII